MATNLALQLQVIEPDTDLNSMYHSSIFQRQRQLTSYGIRKSL